MKLETKEEYLVDSAIEMLYPTAESYGTLAGVLRMLADDVEVEVMAREKEIGGGQ